MEGYIGVSGFLNLTVALFTGNDSFSSVIFDLEDFLFFLGLLTRSYFLKYLSSGFFPV